jgi:hypothetical protein
MNFLCVFGLFWYIDVEIFFKKNNNKNYYFDAFLSKKYFKKQTMSSSQTLRECLRVWWRLFFILEL